MQRKYPKCFGTDKDAVSLHDLMTRNQIHGAEAVYLFRLYTLLLCANAAFLEKRIGREDVERRILNFLGIEGITGSEIPIRILDMLLDKNTDYFESLLRPEDRPTFARHHGSLRTRLLGTMREILS